MAIPYTAPLLDLQAYNCPICGAYANHHWYYGSRRMSAATSYEYVEGLKISQCTHCGVNEIWLSGKLLYPTRGIAPMPNQDMPNRVLDYYHEAVGVVNNSPRSASALLRLGIEELFNHIFNNGKSINHNIAALVKDGISSKLQKALDILRVVGNNAVHAGQIDFNDTPEIASKLFILTNYICDELITNPKELDDLYLSLPEKDRLAIEKRDLQNKNASN